MKPEPLEVVTVDDIVRGGACRGGAVEWRDEHAPLATAMSVDEALVIADGDATGYIARAAGRAGYGYGNGYGDGDGDGDGNGNGYGNGNGNGDGYGNGDGNGNG